MGFGLRQLCKILFKNHSFGPVPDDASISKFTTGSKDKRLAHFHCQWNLMEKKIVTALQLIIALIKEGVSSSFLLGGCNLYYVTCRVLM